VAWRLHRTTMPGSEILTKGSLACHSKDTAEELQHSKAERMPLRVHIGTTIKRRAATGKQLSLLRLRGQGMNRRGEGRGDQFVKLQGLAAESRFDDPRQLLPAR
jgi:hypothetical protein